jgi:dienelactone hydrolase
MNAQAMIATEEIEYRQGDTPLKGYLAYDRSKKARRPGVVIVHDYWGIKPYTKRRAEGLAELGYIAFAIDMYGKGKIAKDTEEAGALAGIYKSDQQLMRARARAGLEVLQKHQLVDTKRIAAIGYCFGGTTALEMARSGADLVGVVSFHGGLATRDPRDARNIRGKVLVLHGADDPLVPPEEVLAFEGEMRKVGIDWQIVVYGGAVHAFSNPEAGNDPSLGAAYNEKADKRSWEAMKTFFEEIFK